MLAGESQLEGQLLAMLFGCHAQALQLSAAGQREIAAVATAMARLPQRVVWKMGDKEVAQAGGLPALNLTANIKVRLSSQPFACRLYQCASHRAQGRALQDAPSNR